MNESKNTALVLSGGGAKGAFQVGALKVLREAGYSYDAISGISVGTLNGSMLASGQFDKMVTLWEQLTPSKVRSRNSLLKIGRQYITYKIGIGKPPTSLFNNQPLRGLLVENLLGMESTIPFHFGYVKLDTGQYVKAVIRWNDHKVDEQDIDRVMASTAIPAIFNPSVIGGSLSVDGGIRNISPIADILPYDPDQLILIPTEPIGQEKEQDDSRDIIQIAVRAISIMLDEIFHEDIDRFLTINRLVNEADEQGATLTKSNGSPYKFIDPIIIAPDESLGSALNFENASIRENMAKGEQKAREVLRELQVIG